MPCSNLTTEGREKLLRYRELAEAETEQNKAQRRAALFMGRATTGTGLIAFFASMAAAGLLSRGDDEDDPDAKALRAQRACRRASAEA